MTGVPSNARARLPYDGWDFALLLLTPPPAGMGVCDPLHSWVGLYTCQPRVRRQSSGCSEAVVQWPLREP